MVSLRTRVLASVLALAAAGLVLLAAVTYAEQKSFLEDRLNQEVRAAGPAISEALDAAGFRPAGDATSTQRPGPGLFPGRGGPGRRGGPGGPAGINLPPGTYGQRRDASGKVLGHVLITYGQTPPPAPNIPASLPVGRLLTVGSSGSSGLQYRLFVSRDPEDSGLTVVAVPLREVHQTLDRLLVVEALVIGGVLLALGVSAFFVVKLGLRPLDRIEVTAGQIAAGDLSRRVSPANPRTEVGRLGLALNAMLDRLEQAFSQRKASEERLRRFLADASHELRTPLASIRGYAELFRMGATEDAADTEMAMRRIEEESKRMGVLVEDLLTLARLDETPEREPGPVDVSALAADAVEDARATAPERRINLSVDGPVVTSGDPHQLRQVLANLLRNALVHTPAGTPVDVTIGERDSTITVQVRDHGTGLPPNSHPNLFERFWRAQGGRERGRAGAGLGLAIVREIVEAHGGRIRAENAPGGGALFVVELPRSSPRPARQTDA